MSCVIVYSDDASHRPDRALVPHKPARATICSRGQGSWVVSTTSRVSPASGRHRWYGPACPVPDDHEGGAQTPGGVFAGGPCPLRFFNGHGSRLAEPTVVLGPTFVLRQDCSPCRRRSRAGMSPATGSDIDRVLGDSPAQVSPNMSRAGVRHNALSLSLLPAAAGGQSAKLRCSR